MTLSACAALVERGDPDRFLATMSLPQPARDVLFPLYAFNIEIARAPWVTEEPMIAEMRLQWWRDAVEEIGQGQPPRSHEVIAPLARAMERDPEVIAKLLDGAVAARRWDIHRDPFEVEADFEAYLDATSGNLAWAAAVGFGAPDHLEASVRDAAWAGGLANWFRAIPEFEARGRKPLVDGRPEAVAALAREGLARLERARKDGFWRGAAGAAGILANWPDPAAGRESARPCGAGRTGDERVPPQDVAPDQNARRRVVVLSDGPGCHTN